MSPATIVADPASKSTDVSTATLVPPTTASPVPGGTGATDVVLTELASEVVEATSGGVVVESSEGFLVVPDSGTVDVESEEMVVVVPDGGIVDVEEVLEVDVEEVVVTPGQYKPCAESYQVGLTLAQNAARV